MQTVDDTFTGHVYLWAYPLGEQDTKLHYEFSGSKTHWHSKAVRIVDHELTVELPPQEEILSKAITTIEDAIKEEQAQHHKKMAELREYQNQLLRLTYKPEDVEPEEATFPRGTTIEGAADEVQ